MKNKVNNFILSLFVFTLSFFLILPGLPNSFSSNVTHEIRTFEDLVNAASLSRSSGYNSDTYILMNNIVITQENQNTLENSDFNYISFGSSDNPFSGVFDGNGYSISNLSYDADLSVKSDTGLFSETDGATIRNLIIDNANLQADYRGGIVVGYSNDTLIENVIVKNSHLNVAASNNVLTLITDGGIRGGAIVGEAVNTIIYNCESSNTIVNTNNTAGVAALSGKGLTLGALVGISDNTLIEYSRAYDGIVKNYYDVAVGALGGNTLYVGGIAGKMRNSSKVIDSFSTAELYYYCATYVSVGAGNSGHIGGISATMEGDSCEIIRSHYAGNATSRQYNAVLVIPIIQNNVNISGLVDVFDGGSVVNSYFKPSVSSDTDMDVLGNDSSTSSYGPINDEKYINKDFWQSVFYDLMGNIKRDTTYNSSHYNKWVMDYNLGIPVHGKSVSATFDFIGASTVIIEKTNLIDTSVSTTNPYVFAVQGLTSNEYNISLSALENTGYKFVGWYKVPNVVAWQLEENHEYFDDVFSKYEVISTDLNLENIPCDDNNLFIARFKASVIFHDINKDIINTNGALDNNTDDDWYDYNDEFPSVLPINKPSSDTASLIGWTTKEGGYSAISMSELSTIKNNGTFYELDSLVTTSLNLYPVYADLISNITTIFEGNELDSSDNISLRENVGYTTSVMNDEGNAVINALGYSDNNAFATGYRFLGWYDEDGNKVSNDASFILDGYDLTQTHTFIARLEYKVDYYGTTTKFYDSSDFDGNPFSKPFASVWHTFNQTLVDQSGSVVIEQGDTFTGWYEGIPSLPHDDSDYDSCSSISTTKQITEALTVHAHVSGSSNYEIYMITDFPGAGDISYENSPAGANFKVSLNNIKSGYNFLFWASSRDNGNRQETSTSPTDFDSGGVFYVGADYGYEAHLDANVVFHDKTSSVFKTVTRRYQEKVFSTSDLTYQYTWPIEQSNMNITISDKNVSNGIHTSTAFAYNILDSNLQIEGYRFIGWIDKNSILASDWDYIYGTSGETYSVSSDPYVTSSISTASAYLLSEEDICTAPMDIYPVYVKYDIITKTNISNEGLTVDINVPSNPTYVIEETGNLYAYIYLTPNLDTYVIGDSGEKYTLTSIIRLYEDGKKEIIEASSDGTYKYDVSPDITYTFVANYEPLVLIYHLNDTEIETIIKTTGQEVGDIPSPTYDLSSFTDKHLFVGYTKTKPNSGYHNFNTYALYEESNIPIITSSMLVSSSMELWPVFVSSNIVIDSNIDSYLTNNSINLNSVRNYSRIDTDKFKINVDETEINGYEFIGWYKNYQSLSEPGELITVNTEFTLTHLESISSDTYTAVYKLVYNVNYYDKENNLLYSVKVAEDDNRTFVISTIDDNGNEILTPIDYEAFEAIYNTLSLNETFYKWQWIKDDNTIVDWDDFYDQIITSDVDLYPVIVKVTAMDSSGNEIDVTGIDEQQPEIILGIKNNSFLAYLNVIYEQKQLTIHISKISYNKTDNISSDINGINVTFYAENDTDSSIIGEEKTNEEGNAIFYFKGLFTILKNKLDTKTNDVFIFNIYNKNDLNNKILTVSIKNGESIKLLLPYGEYVIIEDENWAWRYEYTTSGNFNVNNQTSGSVIFENTIKNNKWFDNMHNIKNRF